MIQKCASLELRALSVISALSLVLQISLGAGIAFLGTSCSGPAIDENDPTSLMADAESDIESDHYQIAIDKLRALKSRFPYSKQALLAQLRIADVYFLQESYAEAALAYETFKDLHPKHEKVPYALFRMAKSYHSDMPTTVARDMTSATKALDTYELFIRQFPNAAEAPEAKTAVAELRQKLAEKELYVAQFYFKREFYSSARGRFAKVIERFSDTAAAGEAKAKVALIDTYIKEGKGSKADAASTRNQSTGTLQSPMAPPSILGPTNN